MNDDTEIIAKLSPTYYDLYQGEMRKRNGKLLRYLALFGLAMSSMGMITRIVFRAGAFVVPFALILVWSLFLLFAQNAIMSRFESKATLVLYVAQAPIWIVGILLGSVLDPNNPAITFYIFVPLLPLFVLDRPQHVLGYSAAWILAYVAFSWVCKPIEVFLKDLTYLLPLVAAAFVTVGLILVERLDGVKLFVESEDNARTDAQTGLKNSYALTREYVQYQGAPLVVGIIRIDDLSFFRDVFGSALCEDILRICAQTLIDTIGHRRCYRYTEQEFVVVLPRANKTTFTHTIMCFLAEFAARTAREHDVRLACCVGYMYGSTKDEEDFELMLNHCEARLGEARHAGKSQIRGKKFDHTPLDAYDFANAFRGNLQSDSVDLLTGLPNMQTFSVRASSLLDTIARDKGKVVIIYLDLKNFKSYNEDFGFQAGDDLLRNVAKVLRESFPERLVARFGDDHFVVMCYENEYESGLEHVLNAVYDLHGTSGMPLKAGVYIYENKDEEIDVACDRARTACNSIKERYDLNWRLYDDELRRSDEQRTYVISHVDDAVKNGWLRVYYQPIISAKTRDVVECEALVRWIDPIYGFLPPFSFIGALEDAHLIHKVDLWVAEQVCADYRNRVSTGLVPLPVSINLSRLDFKLCDVESELVSLVEKYDVPINHLHVEITESAISEDFDQLIGVVKRLKKHGFEMWLDDFGSDYSSLTTLKDFACDVVKLDLMFLRSFDGNERSRTIISQVVQLVQSLGARSLTEGVETQEHLDFLSSIGCDYAQGYLISKPEPMDKLQEMGLLPTN